MGRAAAFGSLARGKVFSLPSAGPGRTAPGGSLQGPASGAGSGTGMRVGIASPAPTKPLSPGKAHFR